MLKTAAIQARRLAGMQVIQRQCCSADKPSSDMAGWMKIDLTPGISCRRWLIFTFANNPPARAMLDCASFPANIECIVRRFLLRAIGWSPPNLLTKIGWQGGANLLQCRSIEYFPNICDGAISITNEVPKDVSIRILPIGRKAVILPSCFPAVKPQRCVT